MHRPVSAYRLAIFSLRHPRSLEVRPWKHKQIKQQNFACGVELTFVSWITLLYRWYWLAAVQCIFEQCGIKRYLPASLRIWPVLHQIKICALIPNSWFRSFCWTRFQAKWASGVELEDNIFARKLAEVPGRSQLRLWPQQDALTFGHWLRLAYKPPRECQYESCKD